MSQKCHIYSINSLHNRSPAMRAYIQKPCCNLHCSTACECYAALSLELGTGGNESLAGFVGFVFLIIDAILDGAILKAPTKQLPIFDFTIPTELPGVDPKILDPRDTYQNAEEWTVKANDLAARFIKNFKKYETNEAGKALVAAGPQL